MSYQKVLEDIGLSPNEAKIYETLIERGESSVADVSVRGGLHRRNAYDAIERLIDKGLVFQIATESGSVYNAVHPGKLMEIEGARYNELTAILPALEKKFGRRLVEEEAYIYRGLEGQKNIFQLALDEGEDNYFIGAKGGWFDPRLEKARKKFMKEASKKRMTFFQLFDHAIKRANPTLPKVFEGKLKHRYLPKAYPTDSAIHIFGDYVVTYSGIHLGTLDDSIVFFVLHSKQLADDYRTWFSYLWEQSKK